eukprot:PRCOL_00006333-RA
MRAPAIGAPTKASFEVPAPLHEIPAVALEALAPDPPAPAVSAPRPPDAPASGEPSTCAVRRIDFLGARRAVVMQSKNGPCPLLAIANVLLLRNAISLREDQTDVSLEGLTALVAGHLLDANERATAPGGRSGGPGADVTVDASGVNLRQNIADTLAVLPKLATGLDVNVAFGGTTRFEFTGECAIFDLLDILLCHGWVADSADAAEARYVTRHTYNTLVERLIALNDGGGGEQEAGDEAAAARAQEVATLSDFLDRTQSQLTPRGLVELKAAVRERQLAVLFRNNHFGTIFKIGGEVYLLATDQGFMREASVVWEKLDGVSGDTQYVGADFSHHAPAQSQMTESEQAQMAAALLASAAEAPRAPAPQSGEARAQARMLQQVREAQRAQESVANTPGAAGDLDADFALALALADEEEERQRRQRRAREQGQSSHVRQAQQAHAQQTQAQRRQRRQQGHTGKRSVKDKAKDKCVIS